MPLNLIISKTVYSHSTGNKISTTHLDRHYDRENLANPLDNKSSVLSQMLKDRTMTTMIRNGKGSDPGIKREVMVMESEKETKRKENWLASKKASIAEKKRKYGIK